MQRVRPCGEDLHVLASILGQGELHNGPFRPSDPVALCFLDAVRPLELVQVVQQTVGVGRDAHHPLPHGLLHHGVSSTLAQSVLHFVVGEDRAQFRTPVHFAVCQVGDPEVHQEFGPLGIVHRSPIRGGEGPVEMLAEMGKAQCMPPRLVAGGLHVVVAIGFKQRHQLRNGARASCGGVVPAFEEFSKNPLRPSVVGGVARANLA